MLAAYDAIDDVLDDRFSYEAMSLAEEDSKRNKNFRRMRESCVFWNHLPVL